MAAHLDIGSLSLTTTTDMRCASGMTSIVTGDTMTQIVRLNLTASISYRNDLI